MKIILSIALVLLFSSANAESIDQPAAINKFTASFKTYNGKTLVGILKQYGLGIRWIETTPLEKLGKSTRKVGDRDGDIVVTLFIEGSPKPMPCGLDKWISQGMPAGHGEDTSEIIYRKGNFITDTPELNPILYWAATSKCSAAYDLPM